MKYYSLLFAFLLVLQAFYGFDEVLILLFLVVFFLYWATK